MRFFAISYIHNKTLFRLPIPFTFPGDQLQTPQVGFRFLKVFVFTMNGRPLFGKMPKDVSLPLGIYAVPDGDFRLAVIGLGLLEK